MFCNCAIYKISVTQVFIMWWNTEWRVWKPGFLLQHINSMIVRFYLTSVKWKSWIVIVSVTIHTFYILLTVHHVMILGKWPTWRTFLFYVFIYIFNSLHVSNTLCSSSGETNCVNTASGSCHFVSVALLCAGQKFTSDLHMTQSDSYQRLYWHNLSLLMMNTMCSKHVES